MSELAPLIAIPAALGVILAGGHWYGKVGEALVQIQRRLDRIEARLDELYK